MQRYNKKMKILFDSDQSIDYLRQNSLITIAFGECSINTDELAIRLRRLSELEEELPSILEENKNVQQLQEKAVSLSSERDELQQKLSEKTKPIQQYQTENNTLTKSNAELTKQLEEFTKNYQLLQNEKKDLLSKIKELNESLSEGEDVKYIFHKWGTYQKFQLDLKLIEYLKEREGKVTRQKEITTYFNEIMAPVTCRHHLYKLLKLGIIREVGYAGSYTLSPSGYEDVIRDAQKLVKALLGEELFNLINATSEEQ